MDHCLRLLKIEQEIYRQIKMERNTYSLVQRQVKMNKRQRDRQIKIDRQVGKDRPKEMNLDRPRQINKEIPRQVKIEKLAKHGYRQIKMDQDKDI